MKFSKKLLCWILAFTVVLFQLGCATAPVPPKDEFVVAIDGGFSRWSSIWSIDRYIPNSISVVDRNLKGNIYVLRGGFSFVRFGTLHTIPFTAEFTKSSQGHTLANLCYNDNTSGMIDCINPSIDNIAKVRYENELRGLAVIAGVVTLIAVGSMIGDSSSDSSYSNTGNQGLSGGANSTNSEDEDEKRYRKMDKDKEEAWAIQEQDREIARKRNVDREEKQNIDKAREEVERKENDAQPSFYERTQPNPALVPQ